VTGLQLALVNVIRNGTGELVRQYTVHFADGAKIDFGNAVRDPDGALETIKKQVYPRLAAAMWADFDAGRTVRFEPLTADRHSLMGVNAEIRWEDLASAQLKQGTLILGRRSDPKKPFQFALANVRNTDLLMALVNHHMKVAA
jgi:hypothetical protein